MGSAPAKGQLILKCLFGVFNSSKKQMKTIRLEVPYQFRFSEESKRHFEIN